MEAKGKTLLKVVSIIMIIGGAIGIVLNALSVFGGSILLSAGMGQMLFIALIICLVGSILELITGIIGVANCKKPEKANVCIAFAFICLIICLAGQILTFISYSSAEGNNIVTMIISCVLSLVLPVLYLIGAFRNKNSSVITAEDGDEDTEESEQ